MAEARRLTQVSDIVDPIWKFQTFQIKYLKFINANFLQAERCSLFLVDKKHEELVAKVFDGNILPDGTTEVLKYL